jgi:hypothetical protein
MNDFDYDDYLKNKHELTIKRFIDKDIAYLKYSYLNNTLHQYEYNISPRCTITALTRTQEDNATVLALIVDYISTHFQNEIFTYREDKKRLCMIYIHKNSIEFIFKIFDYQISYTQPIVTSFHFFRENAENMKHKNKSILHQFSCITAFILDNKIKNGFTLHNEQYNIDISINVLNNLTITFIKYQDIYLLFLQKIIENKIIFQVKHITIHFSVNKTKDAIITSFTIKGIDTTDTFITVITSDIHQQYRNYLPSNSYSNSKSRSNTSESNTRPNTRSNTRSNTTAPKSNSIAQKSRTKTTKKRKRLDAEKKTDFYDPIGRQYWLKNEWINENNMNIILVHDNINYCTKRNYFDISQMNQYRIFAECVNSTSLFFDIRQIGIPDFKLISFGTCNFIMKHENKSFKTKIAIKHIDVVLHTQSQLTSYRKKQHTSKIQTTLRSFVNQTRSNMSLHDIEENMYSKGYQYYPDKHSILLSMQYYTSSPNYNVINSFLYLPLEEFKKSFEFKTLIEDEECTIDEGIQIVKQHVDNLDQAFMEKGELLTEDMTVYRGSKYRFHIKFIKKEPTQLLGFISTSTNKRVAAGFGQTSISNHYTYFITYIISPGISVLTLKSTMNNIYISEDEILLPRGLLCTLVSKNTFLDTDQSKRHLVYRLSPSTNNVLLPKCETCSVLSIHSISDEKNVKKKNH